MCRAAARVANRCGERFPVGGAFSIGATAGAGLAQMEDRSLSARSGATLFAPPPGRLPPNLERALSAVRDQVTQAELIRGYVNGGDTLGYPHVMMLTKRISDGRAQAERAVVAVRDDLNRARGPVPSVFGVVAAENAHLAGIRYAALVVNHFRDYRSDRWASDLERHREWFDGMPSGNKILAVAEWEAFQAAAARGEAAAARDTTHSDADNDKSKSDKPAVRPEQEAWEFVPGRFRFGNGPWRDLRPQLLNLLRQFTEAKQGTLTHAQVNTACGGYSTERHYKYVCELNKELCKYANTADKPIRAVPRGNAFRFVWPVAKQF